MPVTLTVRPPTAVALTDLAAETDQMPAPVGADGRGGCRLPPAWLWLLATPSGDGERKNRISLQATVTLERGLSLLQAAPGIGRLIGGGCILARLTGWRGLDTMADGLEIPSDTAPGSAGLCLHRPLRRWQLLYGLDHRRKTPGS